MFTYTIHTHCIAQYFRTLNKITVIQLQVIYIKYKYLMVNEGKRFWGNGKIYNIYGVDGNLLQNC